MKHIILTCAVILSGWLQLMSQDISPEEEFTEEEVAGSGNVVEATDSVEITFPDYEPWEVATLQGKLKMQGLPLSPTVKIFMQRDSLIDLSLRAPFLGEVGRMKLTPDSILMVNKMNKTYWTTKKAAQSTQLPLKISDIQDLLLARFFLPGFNVMEEDLESLTDIFVTGEQINVVPKEQAEIPGVKYAFAVDEEFNPIMLVVVGEERPDMECDIVYYYNSNGYDLWMGAIFGDKKFEATLELKFPEMKGEVPKDIDIRKFKEVSFDEFRRGM